MQIRILYLIESLGAGGAEGSLYSFLKFLDRDRFDALVCPLYTPRDHWREAIGALDYPIVSPNLNGRWDWRRGVLALAEILKGQQISLIHTQLFDANLYGRILARKLSLPVVTSLQNADYEPEVCLEDSEISRFKLGFFRTLDKYAGRLSGYRWVAVSEYVKMSAIKRLGILPSRIEVIFNSIDFQHFIDVSPERRREIRRQLGAEDHHQLLLSVGRLHPQKGHRYLIGALPDVLSKFPAARLLLVGIGSRRCQEELSALAQSLGVSDSVQFLGIRRDIAEILAACDLFVFPSLYEGLPVALLEALAMKRACVASRIAPVEEILKDRVSGLLVEPRSSQQLAAAITELLADPARCLEMGRLGRILAEDRFEIRNNVRALEAFYERALCEWASR